MKSKTFVLRATAGSGKTQIYAEEVARKAGCGRIEIYAPTHKLGEHWKASILKYDNRSRVQVIAGRGHQSNGGSALCAKHEAAAELSRAGLSVYSRLCTSPAGCCQHLSDCAYLAQFLAPADVYIYTHAHLPLDRGFLDRTIPHTVVIDEAYFSVCLQSFSLNIALLAHPNLPAKAIPICHRLARLWPPGPEMARYVRQVAQRGGGLRTAIEALRAAAPAVHSSQSDAEIKSLIAAAPSFQWLALFLEHLAAACAAKDEIQSVDFDYATGTISVHHRRDITRFNPRSKLSLGPDITILDATAAQSTTQALFPGAEIHALPAKRNAYVIQCASSVTSTSSINPKSRTTPQTIAESTQRLSEVQLLIDQLSPPSRRLLVVGPSAITGNPAKGIPALVTVRPGCALAHFNALRGVDSYKDFENVLIIGRNEPPVKAVENLARALHYDSPTPLALPGRWKREPRGYRLVQGQEGVDVCVHPDSRVQDIVEQHREHESSQAIDRLRLIHNTTTKLVVILCNIPLDIQVDQLMTWDELVHGSRLEQAWSRSDGLMPIASTWLAANFPDLWSTAAAAKKDAQRHFKRGQFSNRFTIGKTTPFTFQYRGVAQRRWSHCLSWDAAPEGVSEALERLLGHPVKVRGPIPAPLQ
jgi:hypothetical protein